MEFLLILTAVIFVLYVFFTYPLVAILRSDDFVGRKKVSAFILVLLTSWLGYFLLKFIAKK